MSGLDLYLSQRTLALMFVYAAVTGFGLGALYDALRILRMPFGEVYVRPGRDIPSAAPNGQGRGASFLISVLRFFCDLLFMLAAAVALILLCYYTNDGQLRAPAPVGMACGFFVYRHTLSPWVLRLTAILLRQIRRGMVALLRLAVLPLRWLWRVTMGRMTSSIRNARREKQTLRRIRDLTDSAERGFDLLGEPLTESITEPHPERQEADKR